METVITVIVLFVVIAITLWVVSVIWSYLSNLGTMSGTLFVIAILLVIIIFQLRSIGT